MERFLSAGFQSGGRPVIVLTKADVVDDPLAQLEEARASEEVEVFVVCALSVAGSRRQGNRSMRERRPLSGAFRAGKSTLINRLCGLRLEVGEVESEIARAVTRRLENLSCHQGQWLSTPGLRNCNCGSRRC